MLDRKPLYARAPDARPRQGGVMSSAPRTATYGSACAPARRRDLDEVMRDHGSGLRPVLRRSLDPVAMRRNPADVRRLADARRGRATATVGFSLLRAVADEAELLLLAVDPARQRRGIGHALLDHFIDDARGTRRAPAPP